MVVRRRNVATLPAAKRLYLITPRLQPASLLADDLVQAFNAADVAAVLMRLTKADDAILIEQIRRVAPIVQEHGVALLLDGRPDLVVACNADGAHLTGAEALRAALAILKPSTAQSNLIAGVGGLTSRHDAMVAGEAGSDYLMFGEPDDGGLRPSPLAILERVRWWTELFEVPAVAYAAALDEIDSLSHTAVEFVAVDDAIWNDARGIEVAIRDATDRLKNPEPVR